jgi:hypothetical protein
MSAETTKSLSSTTDLKKKRKRYVYLEKFKTLEATVEDHDSELEEINNRLKSLYVIIVGLTITVGILFGKVFIG